jgi:O-antigen/teichoic acid export membrane protein
LNKDISFLLLLKQQSLKNITNAGMYFLGSIVQSILSLIAQPIYSLHLTADQFGIIGYFDSIQSVFSPIFIFGMTQVYLMRYFKQNDDLNKRFLFNITFYLCCFNTIILFVGHLAIYLYFRFMHVNIPLNPYAWFILIALLLENIKSAVLINLRIRKKALSFFSFSVINSVLNFGLGLLFVAYFKWGAEGRMLAPIISSLAMIPYCVYLLRQFTTVNFNINAFYKAAKVALPLVAGAYAYVPIINIDRFYLERLNNLKELGLYNIGITIASYAQLAYMALIFAFEPDIFKSVAEKNIKKILLIAAILFAPFLLFVLIFMMFTYNIISVLTSGRYIGAAHYTIITLISVFLISIHNFMDKIFIAMGKTIYNLYVNTIGGLLSIVILYIAVSKYAFNGAAYGKVIVFTCIVIISFILISRNIKLKY